MIMFFIGLGTVMLGVLWLMAQVHRNSRVYNYRANLIIQIRKINALEISKGINSRHAARWEWFQSVSYDTMVNKWWKPLDSFYPDKAKWLNL